MKDMMENHAVPFAASVKVVKRLISGRGVFICDECVDFCKSMLDEEKESDAAEQLANAADLPKPRKSRQS